MQILSQSWTELVLQKPMDRGAAWVPGLYRAAWILTGVIGLCVGLRLLFPIELYFLAFALYAIVFPPLMALLAYRTSWDTAAIRCTFDRTRGVVDVVRTRLKSTHKWSYPLSDFKSAGVDAISREDSPDSHVIRLYFRKSGQVKLSGSEDQAAQAEVAKTINEFVRTGAQSAVSGGAI